MSISRTGWDFRGILIISENQYDKVVKRRSECRLYKLTGGQAGGQADGQTGSARY